MMTSRERVTGTNALTLTWLTEVDRDYAVEIKLSLLDANRSTNTTGIDWNGRGYNGYDWG